jgi:hypothetical protein
MPNYYADYAVLHGMRLMKTIQKTYVYQAPSLYTFLFYSAVSAWTILAILFLVSRIENPGKADVTQLLIIAFIVGITWYFSLAISYRIEVDEDGAIRLTSFRRVVRTRALDISLIQGPLLPVGFVRFRLEREKVYLFCIATDQALHEALAFIRTKNPDIKFKST